MKFIPGVPPTLELSRRNIVILLAKLDDICSARMIGDPDHLIYVHAVEEGEKYDGKYLDVSRATLRELLSLLDSSAGVPLVRMVDESIVVHAVENSEHYKTRPPGPMYMPSSGQVL